MIFSVVEGRAVGDGETASLTLRCEGRYGSEEKTLLLFSEDAPTCDLSDVSVGASGPMVSYVQALLKKASLYEGEITGTFDAATDAAVRKYQNYAGLPVDGILTKEQQASLVDLIDELLQTEKEA